MNHHDPRTVLRMLALALLPLSALACDTNAERDLLSEQSRGNDAMSPRIQPATETGQEVLKHANEAAAIAIAKAEELEYKLDELLLVLNQQANGGWHVEFNPKSDLQEGGNLTIEISETGTITDVKRWR